MRKKRNNEIRTPRSGAKVGVRAVVGQEPVALVKQGDKFDTLSVQEFATALCKNRHPSPICTQF